MEKRDILSKLKAKYSKLGFSNEDLEEFADAVYSQNSEATDEQLEAAIDRMEPYLKTFQKRADKLRSEKAAEKKAPSDKEAEGAPGENKPKQTTGEDEQNSILKALETITKRLDSIEGEKIHSTRKTNFEKTISKLPESLRKAYSHIDLKRLSDEEYEELISQISEETKDVQEEASNRRAVFNTPLAGKKDNQNKLSDKEVDEIVDQMKV